MTNDRQLSASDHRAEAPVLMKPLRVAGNASDVSSLRSELRFSLARSADFLGKAESRRPRSNVVPDVRKGRVALGPATDIPILHYHSLLFRSELTPAFRPDVRIV